MINYFFVYNGCVFYEIILLSYFLKSTGQEVEFCSVNEDEVLCWEGFTVKTDRRLKDIDVNDVNSFCIPGGVIANIPENDTLTPFLNELMALSKPLFAICAGAELLSLNGLLKNKKSTIDNKNVDIVVDGNLITAEPNAYVDFALEAGKMLNIFSDEDDYQETVDFFKLFKKV